MSESQELDSKALANVAGERRKSSQEDKGFGLTGQPAYRALELFADGYAHARSLHPLTRQTEAAQFKIENPFGKDYERTVEIITPFEAQVEQSFGDETRRRELAAKGIGGFIYKACTLRESTGKSFSPKAMEHILYEEHPEVRGYLSGWERGSLVSELTGRSAFSYKDITPLKFQFVGLFEYADPDKPLKMTVDSWIDDLFIRANAERRSGEDLNIDYIREMWRMAMRATFFSEGYVDVEHHLRNSIQDIFGQSLVSTERKLGLDSEDKTVLRKADRSTAYLWSLPEAELTDMTMKNLAVLGSLIIPKFSQQRDPEQPGYIPLTNQQQSAYDKHSALVILGIGLEAQKNSNAHVVKDCADALAKHPDLKTQLVPVANSLP